MATHSKRVAEGIGRRPGVVCGVSTLITLLVSVLALVVGEFTVSADNDGWQSRTTELANRQMQLEAAEGGLDERRWGGGLPLCHVVGLPRRRPTRARFARLPFDLWLGLPRRRLVVAGSSRGRVETLS